MERQNADRKQAKRINILYWVFTVLFIASMLMIAIPSAMNGPSAYALIVTKMGYPAYFVPFTGYVKILGAIAILIPGFPTIKEWAYAGMLFDLIAVTYSSMALGEPVTAWGWMSIWFILFAASYYFYHKKLRLQVG
jgi:uncharacterized membrane protein YphA (DoxX/SURF4 family)